MRPISPTDDACIAALNLFGLATSWEWMIALDSSTQRQISFRTDERPDGTNSDAAMSNHWAAGGRVIIHHNHPSGESLSFPDWQCLLDGTKPVDEIIACTVDGTVYRGAVADLDLAQQSLGKYALAHAAAETQITGAFSHWPGNAPIQGAGFLGKHAVSIALQQKGGFDYEFTPGSVTQAVLNSAASHLTTGVSAALAQL